MTGRPGQRLRQPGVVLGRERPDLARHRAAVLAHRRRIVGRRTFEQESRIAAAGAGCQVAPLEQQRVDVPSGQFAE